jgi:nicotinamidase-related amidase
VISLVVIDVQNDFVERLEIDAQRRLVEAINELTFAFSASGRPVIFVDTEHETDGRDALPMAREEGIIPAVRGSLGAEHPAELRVPDKSLRFVKAKYSIFHDTAFGDYAHSVGGTFVFAGVNTHACVRTSVVDAVQYNLTAIVARDCVQSYDPGFHGESLRYFENRLTAVLSNESIVSLLRSDASEQ